MNQMMDVFLFLFFVCTFVLSVRFGKRILNQTENDAKNKLAQYREGINEPSEVLEKIENERAYLEGKLSALSGIYGITKNMSFNMRFSEIIVSLNDFLENSLKFDSFRVILLNEEKRYKAGRDIYAIGQKTTNLALDHFSKDLIESVGKSKMPSFLERDKDLFNFGFNKNVKNLLAVPLVAQRKTIAVFLIENIIPRDCDKFFILAPQVALQMERVNLFEDVEKLSIMDGLTKTYLRRYFLERLKEEMIRAKQSREDLAFVMVDLDYFKKCNDTFGHLVGDAVLKEIAHILKENVREIDSVARFGGEEFCLLLPETDKKGACIVAERIKKSIENHTIKAYDEFVKITVSMGISSFSEDAKGSSETLIEKADKALYKAKAEGRNRICLA